MLNWMGRKQMAEEDPEEFYLNNNQEGNRMLEVYVICLSKSNLYLKDIGDSLSLSFVDNPFDALYFTKELAEETTRFLNINTSHFLTVEPLNDEENVQDNS